MVAIPCSRYLPYRHEMSWLPLFGTDVGAAIALSSALLVERRRERRQDHLDRAQLRILAATSGLSDEERANRARTAYTSCFAPRYELEVLAPQSVLSPAQEGVNDSPCRLSGARLPLGGPAAIYRQLSTFTSQTPRSKFGEADRSPVERGARSEWLGGPDNGVQRVVRGCGTA